MEVTPCCYGCEGNAFFPCYIERTGQKHFLKQHEGEDTNCFKMYPRNQEWL